MKLAVPIAFLLKSARAFLIFFAVGRRVGPDAMGAGRCPATLVPMLLTSRMWL